MLSRRQFLAAGAALAPALPYAPPLLRADDEKPNIPITGTSDEKYTLLDDLMSLVITKPKLPGGATLAVAKDGKIVYERGFGYSDQESKAEMKQTATFRISSVSKSFTGVATMQLIEKGKLKLDDKITTVLGLKPGGNKPDERWKKITIRHLLEHRGGWDHSTKGKIEPTFESPVVVKEVGGRHPAMPAAIMQYVLRRPLDFDPGEKFLYCNFGYLLLGRVIEKLGGSKTYAEYVKKNILDPLKLTRVRQGKTLLSDRATDEVRYYSQVKAYAVMGPQLGKPVPAPYGGYCLESMDSHSAWTASAGDLLRFFLDFEDPSKSKLLKAETIETMFARPEGEEKESYYAKGFLVLPRKEKRNYWHDGVMEGTSALVVRREDGVAFAVLFNTRQEVDKTDPVNALEPHLHKVLTAVFAQKK